METGSGVTIRPRWIVLGFLVALVIGGVFAAWWVRPKTIIETAAPEQQLPGGGLMLARQLDPAAKPKQPIPRGARVERIAQLTVQPGKSTAEAGKPCPPVTVDMTLIRERDGGRRVLASSPDGQVVGGIDVPVEPIIVPTPAKRWAAGLSIEPVRQTWGAWVERDLDLPLVNLAARVGVDLNQTVGAGPLPMGLEGRVRLGVAF